jgi:hypothetical protein
VIRDTYVLTATYEGKSAGANLQITVDPALIKPILVITSVYPETNLEMGDSSLYQSPSPTRTWMTRHRPGKL